MTAFKNQAKALLCKSARYQSKNIGTNICLLSAPIFMCLILFIIQILINGILSGTDYECGCMCTRCCYTGSTDLVGREYYLLSDPNTMYNLTESTRDDSQPKCISPKETLVGTCPDDQGYTCLQRDKEKCGVQYSTDEQAGFCAITVPSNWPAVLQTPNETDRYQPNRPATTVLVTSASTQNSQAFGGQLFQQLDVSPGALTELVGASNSFNGFVLSEGGFQFGSSKDPLLTYYVETAFLSYDENYALLPNGTCAEKGMDQGEPIPLAEFLLRYLSNGTALPSPPSPPPSNNATNGLSLSSVFVTCTDAVSMVMASQEEVDKELRCGYWQARCAGKGRTNEYAGAWDFLNTSNSVFNVNVQYNSTGQRETNQPKPLLRIPTMLSQAAKAWWRSISGDSDVAPPSTLLAVMSMPKQESTLNLDFSSLLGPLFFCWVVQLLFPTFLQQLVYEKEKRLRMMMKMHGLGDVAYWAVTYLWFLSLYIVYMAIFIIVGAALNLKIFRKNNMGLQIIFYFLHGNCMISFAFLLSSLFTSSKTASICAAIYVFATGLIGSLLLDVFIDKDYGWLFFIEWVPAFALYRGLQEMASYAFLGVYRGTDGMEFSNLSDEGNGMVATWGIFAVEWFLFLVLGWYLEQIIPTGNGLKRHPLFFLESFMSKKEEDIHHEPAHATSPSDHHLDAKGAPSQTSVTVGQGADVASEAARAMNIVDYETTPIVTRDLRKVFPPVDGGKKKVAVQNMSIAVQKGEVLGLLGPNGAGKTTALSMLVGFMEPSSGQAIINGLDIRKNMQQIYQTLGVCPQHDLLWDRLTGREHLRFYGRLKGLKGKELEECVTDGLRKVNLLNGDVQSKWSSKYSGGMRRRLSVAISFMGNPSVVLLDEPSTGLDPNSRRNLWDVVKGQKDGTAMILTTHNMEEAEALCDRLVIFVDGQLMCIGDPKEITSRYGGYLVYQISVPPAQGGLAQDAVMTMCPTALLTYSLGGTFKYELPTQDVTLSHVFLSMQEAKQKLDVWDWGVSNATLEEVFIKFARSINAEGGQ